MRSLRSNRWRWHRTPLLLLAGLVAQLNSGFCGGLVTTFTQAELQAALAGGGTVSFATNGTVTLINTLSITQDTTIDASGYQVTISGDNAVRLFTVTNANFRVNGVTLADGRVFGAQGVSGSIPGQAAAGACILNQGGTLSLTGCTVTNHWVQGGNAYTNSYGGYTGAAGSGLGGALFSLGGQINLTNCVIGNCGAQGGTGAPAGTACGGALYLAGGRLNLQGVTVVSDSVTGGGGVFNNYNQGAGASAYGGAIYATSNAQVWAASSFLRGNAAVSGAGATSFPGSGTGDGLGGALFLDATCQGMFNQCVVSGNSAVGGNPGGAHASGGSGFGGALFNQGQFQAVNSTFEGNSAVGSAYASINAQPGRGGALYSTKTIVLNGCTFDGNLAQGGEGYYYINPVPGGPGEGGAIWTSGTLAATNSTWSGNSAVGGLYPYYVGYAYGPSSGGALCLAGAVARLVNVTLASNSAGQGGDLMNANSSVLLGGSILAYGGGGNVWGTVTDGGYNISSDNTGGFTNTGSLMNTDPLLDALADNGGPTATINLGLGSPARDAIPVGYPATDQRGVARPQGTAADIGAVEADLVPTTRVHVETVPAGLSIIADGTTVVRTPHTFFWETGSCHTLDASSPGTGMQGTNAQYFWTSWSNGGAVSNQVCATEDMTNTAYFRAQYYLTVNPGTNFGGTVSASNGWYDDGQTVTVTAVPNSGFTSSGWTGSGSGTSYTGPDNPAQVTMNGWVSETALFTYTNPCYFSLSPTNADFPADQELGVVQVSNADTNCAWTIVNPCNWVVVTRWSQSSPTVNYYVPANSDTNARSCTLTIAGLPFTVTQAGKCAFYLDSATTNIGPAAMSGLLSVSTSDNCSWTAVSSAAWLHTTNSGAGAGPVWYTADANPDSNTNSRVGTITVQDQVFRVVQASRCFYSLGASGANIGSASTSGAVTVNTGYECSWTAVSDAGWLHTTNNIRTGAGLLWYSADANSDTNSRTGTITVVDQVFTVLQAAVSPVFANGSFHGLVSSDESPIGQVTLSTTSRRAFSAHLYVDGAGHAFHGQFDLDGKTTLLLPRRGKSALGLDLQLEGANILVGTVSEQGGGWVASLHADREVFSDSNPCDYAGLYTFAIPGSTNPAALPGGDSYGSLRVSARGRVTLAGSLADGTTLAGGTFVAADGRVPLFAALYQNQGLLGAWVQLPLDATNSLSGQGSWTKPPGKRFYPGGLNEPVTLFGMKYSAPVHEPVFDFTDGFVALAGGNVPEAMSVPLKLLSGNKAEPVGTNNLRLSFDASSGRFTGSFSLPPAHASHRFHGILIRQQESGYGYFLGTNQSGYVRLGAGVP